MCELNVLAQFKKYDVSKLHRGFITPDGIETVLREEGVPDDAIADYIDEFMSLDSNGDGKVSYLDLYESMMTRIPDEWLEWIDTKFAFSFSKLAYLLFPSIRRGVADATLLKVLKDNGFNETTAQKLIDKTKKEGRQMVERSYVDASKGYVATVRS